mmetsp:Transcript_12597/g.53160  ORF Transcript_12597/g.53160 Transcript_12597/m.53160 type:complete len:432 (-) Transcript_12597:739-2034(-)
MRVTADRAASSASSFASVSTRSTISASSKPRTTGTPPSRVATSSFSGPPSVVSPARRDLPRSGIEDLGLITRLTDPSLSASSAAERPTFCAGLADADSDSADAGCEGTEAETAAANPAPPPPPSEALAVKPPATPTALWLDRLLRRSLFLASSALVSTRSCSSGVDRDGAPSPASPSPPSRRLSLAGVSDGTGPSASGSDEGCRGVPRGAAAGCSVAGAVAVAARRPLAILSLYVAFFVPFASAPPSADGRPACTPPVALGSGLGLGLGFRPAAVSNPRPLPSPLPVPRRRKTRRGRSRSRQPPRSPSPPPPPPPPRHPRAPWPSTPGRYQARRDRNGATDWPRRTPSPSRVRSVWRDTCEARRSGRATRRPFGDSAIRPILRPSSACTPPGVSLCAPGSSPPCTGSRPGAGCCSVRTSRATTRPRARVDL